MEDKAVLHKVLKRQRLANKKVGGSERCMANVKYRSRIVVISLPPSLSRGPWNQSCEDDGNVFFQKKFIIFCVKHNVGCRSILYIFFKGTVYWQRGRGA